ncbi:hypothetical protein [Enterovibrio calviensis]|uniref:hypothetical protein n=1 Tax=Enterovibrio calviensis TaxID=91359 RepID=UPI0037364334
MKMRDFSNNRFLDLDLDLHDYENRIIFISTIYFFVLYAISISYYLNGFFDLNNIFFDDDPYASLKAMSHSITGVPTRNSYTHVLLEVISIPINVIYFFVPLIDIEYIALIISPLLASLSIVIYYRIVEFFTEPKTAFYISIIFGGVFCNFLFGALPTTYIQGGFTILLTLYYFVVSDNKGYSSKAVWFALAFICGGVTITNLCIFGIIYLTYLTRQDSNSYARSLIVATIITLLALIAIIIVYLVYSELFKDFSFGKEGRLDWILVYTSLDLSDVLYNAKNFLNTFINTVLPTEISFRKVGSDEVRGLSFNQDNVQWVAVLLLVTTVCSIFYKHEERDQVFNGLIVVSILIVIYNFVLHVIFAKEVFLYSQHWISAYLFLLSPLLIKLKHDGLKLIIAMQFIINFGFYLYSEAMISIPKLLAA